MPDKSKRLHYFDGLRVVCALFVVLLHVISFNFFGYEKIKPVLWDWMNVGNSITRVGVSIFFMMSGALLLKSPKNDSIEYVLSKRVLRVFIQLLCFSIIYSFIYIVLLEKFEFDPVDLVKRFIGNGIEIKFWFLYTLIGFYLCLPILRIIIVNTKRKYLWYIVVLSLVNVYFRYFLNTAFQVEMQLEVPMVTSFLGVFILGYLLTTTEISKKKRYIIYFLGILGCLFRIWVTEELSIQTNITNDIWYKDYTFNVLISSVAFFVFARYSKMFDKFSQLKIIKSLSKLSLGIYLIHPVMIRLFMYYTEWESSKMRLRNFILMFVIVSVATIVGAWIMSKIKYVKNLIT